MRRILVITATAAMALSACGADPRTGSAGTASTASASVAPTAPGATADPSSAPEALRFTAPAVGGGAIDFTAYAGRTVAFWFWAPT